MAHIEQHTVYINVLAASGLLTKAIIKYQENHTDVKFKLLQSAADDTFDIQITTKLFYQQAEETNEDQFVYNEKIFMAVPNNERFSGKDKHFFERDRAGGLYQPQRFKAVPVYMR